MKSFSVVVFCVNILAIWAGTVPTVLNSSIQDILLEIKTMQSQINQTLAQLAIPLETVTQPAATVNKNITTNNQSSSMNTQTISSNIQSPRSDTHNLSVPPPTITQKMVATTQNNPITSQNINQNLKKPVKEKEPAVTTNPEVFRIPKFMPNNLKNPDTVSNPAINDLDDFKKAMEIGRNLLQTRAKLLNNGKNNPSVIRSRSHNVTLSRDSLKSKFKLASSVRGLMEQSGRAPVRRTQIIKDEYPAIVNGIENAKSVTERINVQSSKPKETFDVKDQPDPAQVMSPGERPKEAIAKSMEEEPQRRIVDEQAPVMAHERPQPVGAMLAKIQSASSTNSAASVEVAQDQSTQVASKALTPPIVSSSQTQPQSMVPTKSAVVVTSAAQPKPQEQPNQSSPTPQGVQQVGKPPGQPITRVAPQNKPPATQSQPQANPNPPQATQNPPQAPQSSPQAPQTPSQHTPSVANPQQSVVASANPAQTGGTLLQQPKPEQRMKRQANRMPNRARQMFGPIGAPGLRGPNSGMGSPGMRDRGPAGPGYPNFNPINSAPKLGSLRGPPTTPRYGPLPPPPIENNDYQPADQPHDEMQPDQAGPEPPHQDEQMGSFRDYEDRPREDEAPRDDGDYPREDQGQDGYRPREDLREDRRPVSKYGLDRERHRGSLSKIPIGEPYVPLADRVPVDPERVTKPQVSRAPHHITEKPMPDSMMAAGRFGLEWGRPDNVANIPPHVGMMSLGKLTG